MCRLLPHSNSRCAGYLLSIPTLQLENVPQTPPDSHIARGMTTGVTYAYIRNVQVSLIPPWEDQCEWHRMTRMTRPDCAVMRNLLNIHPYIHVCRLSPFFKVRALRTHEYNTSARGLHFFLCWPGVAVKTGVRGGGVGLINPTPNFSNALCGVVCRDL